MLYEVQSGKPSGEVYHWWVFITDSHQEAQECLRWIEDQIAALPEWQREQWLYGPHIYERPDDWARPITWDGHEEVPAPQWPDGAA